MHLNILVLYLPVLVQYLCVVQFKFASNQYLSLVWHISLRAHQKLRRPPAKCSNVKPLTQDFEQLKNLTYGFFCIRLYLLHVTFFTSEVEKENNLEYLCAFIKFLQVFWNAILVLSPRAESRAGILQVTSILPYRTTREPPPPHPCKEHNNTGILQFTRMRVQSFSPWNETGDLRENQRVYVTE